MSDNDGELMHVLDLPWPCDWRRLSAFQLDVLRKLQNGFTLKRLGPPTMKGDPGFVLENPPKRPVLVPSRTIRILRERGFRWLPQ